MGDDGKINDQRTETRKGPRGICVLEERGRSKSNSFLFKSSSFEGRE